MIRPSLLRLNRALMSRSAACRSNFGTPRAHQPAWIDKWEANNKRAGSNIGDGFFRAFNKLRLYENILKSGPLYYGFMVIGSMFASYYWSRAFDAMWAYRNQGRIYRDCPYVYPADEEE
eukprot:GEMP01058443.1.p2 GENE.GEMP01058443.1~~GEMP01058443.1.p2  ORF type:complete len:119 (+),score=26.37 GEMP01058443.1:151-507(+)